MPDMTCPHCGHRWRPRVDAPLKCPNYHCGLPLRPKPEKEAKR